MAKIREIFHADSLSHCWVYSEYKRDNGERVAISEGRSDNYNGHGRANFSGDVFRSYSTVIAKRYDLGDKGILFAINGTDYGPTTAGHRRNVRSAIPRQLNGRETHTIEWNNNGYFPYSPGDKPNWNSAIDSLLRDANNSLAKAIKARDYRQYRVADGLASVAQAERLNSLLVLERGGDIDRVKLDLERVPEYIAKPPNPNQRRYIRDWEEAMEYLPNLPMIAAKVFREDNLDSADFYGVSVQDKVIARGLDGLEGVEGKVTIRLKLSDCPWANIKVVGDRVLTSQGVRLTKAQVEELYEGMLAVIISNGSARTYGGYWIRYNNWNRHIRDSKADLLGTISVGCHYFHSSAIASGYKYILDSLPATSSSVE